VRILAVSALAILPFLGSAMAQTTRGAFGDGVSVEVGGTPPPSPRTVNPNPSGPNISPGHIVNSLQTVFPNSNVQSPGKIHTNGLPPFDTNAPPPGQWTKPKP